MPSAFSGTPCGKKTLLNSKFFENLQEVYSECSEHISPKRSTDRKNTASEREWLPLTAERFSREDALKAEQDLPINFF